MSRMTDKEILKHLAELNSAKEANANAKKIEAWTNTGRFYDELSDDEKDIYALYCGFDRQPMEDVEKAVNGSLHFRLPKREKVPSSEDMKERIAEVEALVMQGDRNA